MAKLEKEMSQVTEELKLGAIVAQEYSLSPKNNSFTASHPDAYFYGIFFASTNRPMPDRLQAGERGYANGDHAYEVLKKGFSDASLALGRPVLVVDNTGGGASGAVPRVTLAQRWEEFWEKVGPRFFQHGRPTFLGVMTVIVALSAVLYVVEAAKHRAGRQSLNPAAELGVPPAPESENPDTSL